MLLRELIQPPATGAPVVATPTAQDPEPTPKDVADIQALIGTIDPQKEQPQTLLNKLSGWMKTILILKQHSCVYLGQANEHSMPSGSEYL